MKRFVLFLTTLLLALAPVAEAGQPPKVFKWKIMSMRNTSAASVVVNTNWAAGGGGSASGFADSAVFRIGATTNTDRDTSQAFNIQDLLWQPSLDAGGGGTTVVTDSAAAIRVPWIGIRVKQDTTSYSFSGTSTADSVFLAAQVSDDGINWVNVNGTPTVAFEVTNGAAGQDGTVPTLVGPYAESVAGSDATLALFDCVPSLRPINNLLIINRSLCLGNGFVRFLINMDGSGQYKAEIGHWTYEN